MHSLLKRSIILTTVFTALTALVVLNSTKLGIAQKQQHQDSSVTSQPKNQPTAVNKQKLSNSQVYLITDIAYQYAAAQRSASALKVLDQAIALTETMEGDCYKATPLTRVANGYILAGEAAKGQKLLTRAFQIAREQSAIDCTRATTSPDSLLNRAVEYAEAGDYNFALSIIDGVDNSLRSMAMAKIAGSYLKNKQPEQARQLINRAMDISLRFPEPLMRRDRLLSIAFELKGQENLELLPPVIKQIQATPYSTDKPQSGDEIDWKLGQTLMLAQMLVATGEKAQAIAVLNQVVPEIQALQQLPSHMLEQIQNLNQAAIQYAAAGQPEQAKTLLLKSITAAESSKPSMNPESALAMVAQAYAEIGQVQTADELTRQIKSVDIREQVSRAIALHYAKTGNLSQATTIARSLKNTKNMTLSNIVRHLLETKQYEQALQVARQEKVDSILPQVTLAFAEAGKPQQALQIAESLQVKEPSDQSVCLDCVMSKIAQSFAQQGQFDQALKVAQKIQSKEEKSHVLTMIAAQYLKTDRIANQNKATEILDQAWKIALSGS